MLIWFDESHLLTGIAVLCLVLLFLWWRRRSVPYLLFLSVFWIYLLMVVSTVIFPIAVNTATVPGSAPHVNLNPFNSGYCSTPRLCLIEILGNVILTIPFGFGVSFLMGLNPKHVVWLAFGLGFGFELSQFVISVLFRSSFRTVDVNDVIMNALGVLVGYALFRGFARLYSGLAERFRFQNKWFLADIYDVVKRSQTAGYPKEREG